MTGNANPAKAYTCKVASGDTQKKPIGDEILGPNREIIVFNRTITVFYS